MAELMNNADKNSGRVKQLKQLPKVDLTAMVDLAFLLITFFMLTTTLAKQKAMDIAMPVDALPELIADDRTMAICLGKDDKLQWYIGRFENPTISPVSTSYNSTGIRKAILEQSERITNASRKGLIVLIKPSDKSNYKNLIDILDEIKIAKIATYAIADITPGELQTMKTKNIY